MSTYNQAKSVIGDLFEVARTVEDGTSLSLTQYTKRSSINSRVFIDQALESEDILGPLCSVLMNQYIGFIMTAMDMNRQISSTKKVRDMMSVVATESFSADPIWLSDAVDTYFSSGPSTMAIATANGSSVVSTQGKYPTPIPSGRVIEMKMGDDAKRQFTITMFLQFLPKFIPTETVEQFVGINFTPSFSKRFLQASVGEISMIKDLIFGADLRKKKFKALTNDKSGALQEMIDRQDNALANSWMKYSQITPDRQNISNTILIFEKHTFDKACHTHGLKFKDFSARQRFFNKTFSMIVVVVDTMYSKVEIFYHGLESYATYKFDQLVVADKKDNGDLTTLMKLYAQGSVPKY